MSPSRESLTTSGGTQREGFSSENRNSAAGAGGTEPSADRLLRNGRRGAAVIWLIILGLAGIAAYLPTFYSLAVSYTGSDSYYAHWFFIPPVSVLFVWLKRESLRRIPVERCGMGFSLVIGGLLLHVFAVWFRVDFVSAFSLVVTVWGLALYFFGKRIVREITFPLLFLLFMVPLPGTLVAPLAFHMKIISGKLAVGIYNLVGGTALLTGSKISFTHGEPLWMGYECSGLRSVISLSSLGAAIAYLVRISGPRKVLLFLSSFPLAILSNSIRVTLLCFAADQWGVKSKAFDVFHDVSSPVVFIIVLGGLFGVHKLLSIGDQTEELQSDGAREAAAPPGGEPLLTAIPLRKLRIIFGLLVIAGILVALSPHFMRSETVMSSLKPVELPQRIGVWRGVGTNLVERDRVSSILHTKSMVLRTYRRPEGEQVSVLVVASDTDRQAFHPPEICMIGSGDEVLESSKEGIETGSGDAGHLYLNTFVRGTRGRPDTLVLYWYMAGQKSMGSRTLQQLVLLFNGARKVPIIGAMVRVTAPLTTMTKQDTLHSAMDFIRSLVPLMPGLLETARKAGVGSGD